MDMEYEDNSGCGLRLGCLGLVLAVFLLGAGIGIGWLLSQNRVENVASWNSDASLATQIRIDLSPVSQTVTPRFTPKPTFTVPVSVVETITPTIAASPTVAATISEAVEKEYVQFTVLSDTVAVYRWPQDETSLLGTASKGTSFLVGGRTEDGVWWMVCCWTDEVSWVKLEDGNFNVDGDANTVRVLALDTPSSEERLALPGESTPLPSTPTAIANATLPPTNTPAASSTPLPLSLDARLERLGVSIEPAEVGEGEEYWKAVEIVWYDEQEAQGQSSIFIDVIDENGNRVMGQPVVVEAVTGNTPLLIEGAPSQGFGASTFMLIGGPFYSVRVEGLASDTVRGLGLGDLERRNENILVAYLIKFQRAIR